MLSTHLLSEKARLTQIIADAQKRLEELPEGSLSIARSNGSSHFRHYLGRKDGKVIERYLNKSQGDLIAKLAQKGYEKSVLKQARVELKALNAYLASRDQPLSESTDPAQHAAPAEVASIKQIYAKLGKERHDLVIPYELPDDDYAQLWEQEHTIGAAIYSKGLIFNTEKGDMVRSKSEVIVSDKLYRSGVPYLYECPLYLKDGGVLHPDFTILNKRTRQQFIWEHFGLMDDPDYRESALRKINTYAKEGITLGNGLIATFESASTPLDTSLVDAIIRDVLT